MASIAVQRQRRRGDRLDRAEGVALDARDLHQAADRIAGHASTAVARSVSKVTARRPPRPNALSRTPS